MVRILCVKTFRPKSRLLVMWPSYRSRHRGRAFNVATKKPVINKSMNLAPILV